MKVYFNDARVWLDECSLHGHLLVLRDDPKNLLFGYSCSCCDEWFVIGLKHLKFAIQGNSALTEDEKEALRDADGREALALTWLSGCVLVLYEV